ncbi:MAG TPA: hypothetical protein VNQ77_19370 [Frankiaceae bacterium]|nr:hypothetical protein [Frankiaceae bacterium]
MRHPADGVLRRLLDEPAGVADPDREHVADCPQCLAVLAALRTDADLVGAALATDGDVDVDAAWRRLSTASATAHVEVPRGGKVRALVRKPAVAAVAVAVVLTGASAAAANNWLRIFRTERIAPVTFTAADLIALPDLSAYGDVSFSGDGGPREVSDAATAARESGLDVPEVASLPRGVTGVPSYQVAGQASATFTFLADRAARTAAAAGETLPTPPAGLHGSQIKLVAGPGVAVVWTQPTGVPSLVVGRAVAPTAFSTAVSFETARDYLLSLPGLPANVAAQLRTFAADGSTLPLPVPADRVTTSPTTVNGVPATVLTTRDGLMAAVVWVTGGEVTVVGGSLSRDEVVDIAEELR